MIKIGDKVNWKYTDNEYTVIGISGPYAWLSEDVDGNPTTFTARLDHVSFVPVLPKKGQIWHATAPGSQGKVLVHSVHDDWVIYGPHWEPSPTLPATARPLADFLDRFDLRPEADG